MRLNSSSLWVLAVLAGLVTIGPLSTDMYLPAQPTIKAELGASLAQIQLTLSVFLIGTAIAIPFWGPLADRFGRQLILIIGFSLFILSSIACAFTTSIEALIALRFVQAIGASVGPILGRTMVRDIYSADKAAKAYSHLASMMALAPALAPIIGAFLLVQFNWQAIFYALALLAIISSAFYLYLIGETLAPKFRQSIRPQAILKNYRLLFSDRIFIAYTLIMSAIFSGLFAFISIAAFIIIKFLQLTPQQFGFCFLFMVLGFMLGATTGAKLSDRLPSTKIILMGISLCSLGASLCLGFSLVEVFHTLALIIPIAIYGIGAGLVLPQCGGESLRHYPNMAGTASSLNGIFQNGAGAIAGIGAATFHINNPTVLGIFLVLAAMIALLCFYLLLPESERNKTLA